ncbi:MAG: hypothetical protein PHE50_00030 [Dehalococcoidales bacterium]|nr:hypothetical protein [Dehalococcoidales bacterium]
MQLTKNNDFAEFLVGIASIIIMASVATAILSAVFQIYVFLYKGVWIGLTVKDALTFLHVLNNDYETTVYLIKELLNSSAIFGSLLIGTMAIGIADLFNKN